MHIGYGTLERLLVTLFDLSESQRGALVGRFKYLQRLGGFGAPGTRGGRARYQLDELLQLVLIFELVDAGCSPTHALRVVRTHWDNLRVNLAHAWKDAVARAGGATPERLLWTVVPHALSELGAGGGMADVDVLERAGELGPAEVLESRRAALAAERHAIFVNLPRLLAACVEAFAVVAPDKQQPFAAALDRLAEAETVGRAK